jgi:hypothetical protein
MEMKTVIIERKRNGVSAPIKITAEDISAENVTKILAHVRAIEGPEKPAPSQRTPSQQQQGKVMTEAPPKFHGTDLPALARARIQARNENGVVIFSAPPKHTLNCDKKLWGYWSESRNAMIRHIAGERIVSEYDVS